MTCSWHFRQIMFPNYYKNVKGRFLIDTIFYYIVNQSIKPSPPIGTHTPKTEKEPPIDTLCRRLSRCLKIDLFNGFKFNVAQRCDAAVSRTRVRAITNILPVARADFFFVITVVASTKVAFPAIPQSTHSFTISLQLRLPLDMNTQNKSPCHPLSS